MHSTHYVTLHIAFISTRPLQALYIPCLIVIGSRTYIRQTCFKLMLLLGIADTACLWASGFFAGYFAITGTVYCSNPTLMLAVCLPAMCTFLARHVLHYPVPIDTIT